MHLSRYTDYAYRVLLYTAINKERCTLSEISSFYGVSIEHLRKVVHSLGQLGYLNTFKGKSGGLELGQDPESINLANIYRQFETVKEPVIDCTKLECLLSPSCRLEKILFDSEKAFVNELEKYSLKDLMTKKTTSIISL